MSRRAPGAPNPSAAVAALIVPALLVSTLLVSTLLVSTLLAGCAAGMYPVGERHAETLRVPTADGAQIALRHFPADPRTAPRTHPVILCHGIMSNTYTWDLDDEVSFAAWLQRRGFAVYALDLRGGGEARRWGGYGGRGYTWSVDDYVEHDVPAAIEAVSARHGGRPVHWVGHSMGGIVMYGWLPRGDQRRVRSLVAVGSPAVLPVHVGWLRESGALLPLAEFFFDELPTGTLSLLGAPWADQKAVWPLHMLWNLDNLRPGSARRMAAHGTANLPARVVRQFYDSLVAGRLQSADGRHDYTAAMADIEVPTLLLGGVLDHLAPPASMMRAWHALGSATKRLVILSRANGADADFGHVDLTLGAAAPRDVFPLIHDWLVARD